MVVQQELINGVDVGELRGKVQALKENPELGKFNFRVSNKWINGGHNRTTVTDFYGTSQVHQHRPAFKIDADEPPVLLGQDQGANPVEHLLNALAGCLTSSIVYHAAIRGIEIEEIESTVEGDIDIRGFMGLSNEVRKGYKNIKVTFRIQSDAPKEKLEELAKFSPVFDVVSHGTDVEVRIE